EDAHRHRVESISEGDPIHLNLVVEGASAIEGPMFAFQVLNVDGVVIFGFGDATPSGDTALERIESGQRVRVRARVENPLVPGRYSINCTVFRNRTLGDTILHDVSLTDFLIRGTRPNPGMVAVREQLVAAVE